MDDLAVGVTVRDCSESSPVNVKKYYTANAVCRV